MKFPMLLFEKSTRVPVTLGGGDIKRPLQLGIAFLTVAVLIANSYKLIYEIEVAKNEYVPIPRNNTTNFIFNVTNNTSNLTIRIRNET